MRLDNECEAGVDYTLVNMTVNYYRRYKEVII